MARFLFYCVNGTGLGHVTRTLAVARQVRRLAPESDILVLTSSENTHLLWQEGIVSVKVPSYEASKAHDRLPVVPLAHAVTAQVVATFRPQIAIVDSQPAGMFAELLSPLLQIPKRVLLFGMFPNYFSQPTYKMAIRYYERIFMPYKEDEKDGIKPHFGERARWVGDILVRSADEILPREVARRRLGFGEGELGFYVGLGGNPGNDQAVDWALDVLAGFPQVRVAFAAQPLSKGAERLSERDGVVAVSHYPIMEYFSAFDAAISSAGFNCAELVHAGLPAIWAPLGHPSTDQEFNAERFASRDLGVTVKLLDADALKAAVETLLDAKKRSDMAKRMRAWAGPNGAEAAARAILDYLETDEGHVSVL